MTHTKRLSSQAPTPFPARATHPPESARHSQTQSKTRTYLSVTPNQRQNPEPSTRHTHRLLRPPHVTTPQLTCRLPAWTTTPRHNLTTAHLVQPSHYSALQPTFSCYQTSHIFLSYTRSSSVFFPNPLFFSLFSPHIFFFCLSLIRCFFSSHFSRSSAPLICSTVYHLRSEKIIILCFSYHLVFL